MKIRVILGSSWATIDPDHETGNEMRKRKGREMRAGKRPYLYIMQRKLALTLMRMVNISIQKDQVLVMSNI